MVSKEGEEIETECPVCDRKIPLDAKKCPGCGADFSISGMEDLEAMATELVRVEAEPTPPPTVEVKVQEEPPQPKMKPIELAPPKEEKKAGVFKRLFGKK